LVSGSSKCFFFYCRGSRHSCGHCWFVPGVGTAGVAVATATIGVATTTATEASFVMRAVMCRDPTDLLTELLDFHHRLTTVLMLAWRGMLLLS
jgi:hypothetical protein